MCSHRALRRALGAHGAGVLTPLGRGGGFRGRRQCSSDELAGGEGRRPGAVPPYVGTHTTPSACFHISAAVPNVARGRGRDESTKVFKVGERFIHVFLLAVM